MVRVVNDARVISFARRYAESNMTATVQIVRKRAAEFDPTSGRLEADSPIPVYEGKARVPLVSGPVELGFGDEPTYYSSAVFSIPVITGDVPMVDDLVRVTVHNDPVMVGRVFQVRDVQGGGQWAAARQLQVVGAQASQQWRWPAALEGTAALAVASGGMGMMSAS